jgi:hypothetical protein
MPPHLLRSPAHYLPAPTPPSPGRSTSFLPAMHRGRQVIGLMARAGTRRTVHRPRPYSARPLVGGLSWPSPAAVTVADTHPQSVPPPPSRLRLPLPRAVLTPIYTSVRVTGKGAGHEELLLPSTPIFHWRASQRWPRKTQGQILFEFRFLSFHPIWARVIFLR